MKKILISLLVPIFAVIGFSSNSFGSSPSASFMNLPVSYFYPNGAEMVANSHDLFVTVADLAKHGFNPGKQSWEQLETNQYVFTLIQKDNFKGVTNTLKILFVVKNDQGQARALMHRVINNGNELTMRMGLSSALETFTYGAYNSKKTTENPNYFQDKQKKAEEEVMNTMMKLKGQSNY